MFRGGAYFSTCTQSLGKAAAMIRATGIIVGHGSVEDFRGFMALFCDTSQMRMPSLAKGCHSARSQMLHSTLELLRPNVQRVVEAGKRWSFEHRHVEHVWTRKTNRVAELI